jgi:hypothetical protein
MLGFALSPDGRTLLIGYGDPFAGGTTSVPGPLGVFKSATDAFAFTPIFGAHVGCLSWTKQGVYVCASQHFDQFELAFSPDADFSSDAGCLSPILRLPEVRGPLACPSDTAGFTCTLYWQAVCGPLRACADAGTSPAGCAGRDAATPVDGGGAVDAAPEGGVTPPIEQGDSADCGCRLGTASRGAPSAGGVLVAWMAAFFRRRRRFQAQTA